MLHRGVISGWDVIEISGWGERTERNVVVTICLTKVSRYADNNRGNLADDNGW